MDNYEFSELLKTLKNKVGNIASIIKPENIQTRLKEIEELENSPSFWSDVKQAGIIGKEKTKITNLLKNYENAFNALNDASELFDLPIAKTIQKHLKLYLMTHQNLKIPSQVLKFPCF